MNQPREPLFNQALLCFTMGIPWVFNPNKIEFNQSDWHDFVSFMVENKLMTVSFPNDHPTFANNVTVGIESKKVIKYREIKQKLPAIILHHLIFNDSEKDEQPKPSERVKPTLP